MKKRTKYNLLHNTCVIITLKAFNSDHSFGVVLYKHFILRCNILTMNDLHIVIKKLQKKIAQKDTLLT